MQYIPRTYDQIDQWNSLMFIYGSALKQMQVKISVMNGEFVHIYNYNPIEHVKARLKTAESIVNKLKRMGCEVSTTNLTERLNDIAGVRIICSFTSDIYQIADMLSRQADITVLYVKDYIKNPKPNGYKSYHMVVTIPVYLSEGPVETKVEVQIRTVAMDFWASLEHKMYYKLGKNVPANLQEELKACASVVDMLDAKMYSLNEAILKWNAQEESRGQGTQEEGLSDEQSEQGDISYPADQPEKSADI